MLLTRRAVVGAGLALVTARAGRVSDPSGRTRLILLGTGGGPRPRKTSSGSAQVIIYDAKEDTLEGGSDRRAADGGAVGVPGRASGRPATAQR